MNEEEVFNRYRVLIETNVLISAVAFPQSISRKCLNFVMDYHYPIICQHSIDEVFLVLEIKFPESLRDWDRLLSQMDFELVGTPKDDFSLPPIRDTKDLPILIAAFMAKPDFIISGDKDFHTQDIREYFAVYTPADFLRDFDHRRY